MSEYNACDIAPARMYNITPNKQIGADRTMFVYVAIPIEYSILWIMQELYTNKAYAIIVPNLKVILRTILN